MKKDGKILDLDEIQEEKPKNTFEKIHWRTCPLGHEGIFYGNSGDVLYCWCGEKVTL